MAPGKCSVSTPEFYPLSPELSFRCRPSALCTPFEKVDNTAVRWQNGRRTGVYPERGATEEYDYHEDLPALRCVGRLGRDHRERQRAFDRSPDQHRPCA